MKLKEKADLENFKKVPSELGNNLKETEAERRFENWWSKEGFDRWVESEEVATQDRQLTAKRLLKEVWIKATIAARNN